MDNFPKKKRTSSSNMDGIIRGRMRRSAGSRSVVDGFGQVRNRVNNTRPQLGSFSKQEGFVPRKTKPLTPDGRSLGRQSNRPIKPIDMKIKDVPKKSRLPKKVNWLRFARRSFAGILLLVLVIGGYLTFKGVLRAKQVFKGGGEALAWDCNPDPSVLKQEGDGRINFLILGKGGPEQTDGPDLTDTIILASVDPCNKEAGLLSIPRDLAVKMESGGTQKINAVYALTKMSAQSKGKSDEEAEKAGIEAIEKSVEDVAGIPINYYVMLDFTAFEQAVNSVGGVDIDVKKSVSERMLLKGKPYRLDVPVGQQHFDGLKALAYTRCRHCDNKSDFGRSERQREVIIALRNKIMSVGTYSNPVKISQLIDSFGTRVRTNLNIKDDAGRLYGLGQEIDSSKISSVSLVDEPNVLLKSGGYYGDLGLVQIPVAGMYRYGEIHSFINKIFRDSYIKKEDAKIVVLNGTSIPGLATSKSEELKGLGYNVIKVDDAPNKNTASTTIVDLRNGEKKYTKRYLELRLKSTTTNNPPEGVTPPVEADFIVILGNNKTE